MQDPLQSGWKGLGSIAAMNNKPIELVTCGILLMLLHNIANAQGFYFDNLCQRVYNRATPDTTIQFYRTGFEP